MLNRINYPKNSIGLIWRHHISKSHRLLPANNGSRICDILHYLVQVNVDDEDWELNISILELKISWFEVTCRCLKHSAAKLSVSIHFSRCLLQLTCDVHLHSQKLQSTLSAVPVQPNAFLTSWLTCFGHEFHHKSFLLLTCPFVVFQFRIYL